jgi:hypothetical protein
MRNRNEEKDNEKIVAQERDRSNKAKGRRKERNKNENLLCLVRAHSQCHHSVTFLTCKSTHLSELTRT